MTKKVIPLKPEPPPSGRVERVRLVEFTEAMDRHHLQYMVGIVEDYIGEGCW